MKSIPSLIVLVFLLSSCSNKMTLPGDYKIQFLPEKATTKEITNLKVTYIIPQNVLSSKGINGLHFPNRHWGRDTKQEKILVNFDSRMLQIERRTDNGVAGSGLIYNVSITKVNESTNKLIILHGESIRTYQDGLIMPFPLPDFDLESYLTSATVEHDFELNSEFPVESIRATFDRMLEKSGDNDYELHLSNASVSIRIKIDPYRNGSKILINAKLFSMKPMSNIIDVSKSISELESYIKNIINS